jgi:hypothetical protein
MDCGLLRDADLGFRLTQITKLQLACLVGRVNRNFVEKSLISVVSLGCLKLHLQANHPQLSNLTSENLIVPPQLVDVSKVPTLSHIESLQHAG